MEKTASIKKDIYFHYKNVGRQILMLKRNKKEYNTYEISELQSINILFTIKEIEDIDKLMISNCFYFLKYFFGKIGIYMNYRYKFSLNKSYHSFIIQTNIKKKQMYNYTYLITNDIISWIPHVSILKKEKEKGIEWTITEMHYFIDKKNTIGFFNLKTPVTIEIRVKGIKMEAKQILTLFKI